MQPLNGCIDLPALVGFGSGALCLSIPTEIEGQEPGVLGEVGERLRVGKPTAHAVSVGLMQ